MRHRPAFWGAAAAALAGHGLILAYAWIAPMGEGGADRVQAGIRINAGARVLLAASLSPTVARPDAQAAVPVASRAPIMRRAPDTQREPPPAMDDGSVQAGLEGYLQRHWLTSPPLALESIDLPFPPVEGLVDLKLATTLFIDEEGIVRHVRIDTPNIHGAFAEAVLGSFAGRKFKPGEVMGQPVRSQLRLEVEFQSG